MSASIFMYEGDGLLHSAPRRPATLGAPPVGPRVAPNKAATPARNEPATETAPPVPAADTVERRSEALRWFFPKIGAWLADRAYFARMREVEAFLSEATDAADLETRIRRIERGMLARF